MFEGLVDRWKPSRRRAPARQADTTADPVPEVLFFVHIPKCAGSSFRHLLRLWFGREALFADTDPAAAVRAAPVTPRAVAGHFLHGAHEGLRLRPRYVSLVRDPADRLVSLYQHARAVEDHLFHARAARMSLAEFYDFTQTDPRGRRQTVAIQCQFLSRTRSFLEARPVADSYAVLEPLERYGEFVARCAALTGLPPIEAPARNVAASDPRLVEDKAALAERIRRDNPEDFQLYRYIAEGGSAGL